MPCRTERQSGMLSVEERWRGSLRGGENWTLQRYVTSSSTSSSFLFFFSVRQPGDVLEQIAPLGDCFMGAKLSQLALFPWRWRSALHRSRKAARLESPPGAWACSPTSAWQPVLVIPVDVLPLQQGDQGVQRWWLRCGKSNFYFLSRKILIEFWNTTSPKRSSAKSSYEITEFCKIATLYTITESMNLQILYVLIYYLDILSYIMHYLIYWQPFVTCI